MRAHLRHLLGALHIVFHLFQCIELSLAWNMCRNRNEQTDRRSAIQHGLLGTLGTLVISSDPAGASDASSSTIAQDKERNGILWRTKDQKVFPATPSYLSLLIKEDLLGSSSMNSTSGTTGIVMVGERHDDFEHHQVQLKMLMTLKKLLKDNGNSPNISVGMEMFHRNHQQYLDSFIDEPSYSVMDLKRDTDWDQTWGYDIKFYLPILLLAKKFSMRLVGLHPSDLLVGAVKEHGLDSIPSSILAGVLTTDKKHKKEYMDLMLSTKTASLEQFDGCQEALDAYLERKYEIQVFREEYMSESAALHMISRQEENDPGWMVVLAGERHVLGRNGLPFRTLRRVTAHKSAKDNNEVEDSSRALNRGVFTIVPKTVSFPIKAKDAPDVKSADYVWYVQRDPLTDFKEDRVNVAPPLGRVPTVRL